MENFENFLGGDFGSSQNSNDVIDYPMSSGYSFMDSGMTEFVQPANIFGSNDDLNSFFTPGLTGPGRSMMPIGNTTESTVMPQTQWDNGESYTMFGQPQAFPFPPQASQPPNMLTESGPSMESNSTDSSFVSPTTKQKSVEISEDMNTVDPLSKPKRGRPRNRKRKQLTAEEEKKKRNAFLERNRRAASKCRKRKKESTERIQTHVEQLTHQAKTLALELMRIREDYARVTEDVTNHAKVCPENGNLERAVVTTANNTFLSGRSFQHVDRLIQELSIQFSLGGFPEIQALHTMMGQHNGMDVNSPVQDNNGQMGMNVSFRDGTMSRGNSQQGLNTNLRVISACNRVTESISTLGPSLNLDNMDQYRPTQMAGEQMDSRRQSHQSMNSQRSGTNSPFPGKLQLNTSLVDLSRSSSFASRTQSDSKDSGYVSTSVNTPSTPANLGSPDFRNFAEHQNMMQALEVPSPRDLSEPSRNFQQAPTRDLRSRKVVSNPATGPTDLDDPSVFLQKNGLRR